MCIHFTEQRLTNVENISQVHRMRNRFSEKERSSLFMITSLDVLQTNETFSSWSSWSVFSSLTVCGGQVNSMNEKLLEYFSGLLVPLQRLSEQGWSRFDYNKLECNVSTTSGPTGVISHLWFCLLFLCLSPISLRISVTLTQLHRGRGKERVREEKQSRNREVERIERKLKNWRGISHRKLRQKQE